VIARVPVGLLQGRRYSRGTSATCAAGQWFSPAPRSLCPALPRSGT
jgi:hypothetical protein